MTLLRAQPSEKVIAAASRLGVATDAPPDEISRAWRNRCLGVRQARDLSAADADEQLQGLNDARDGLLNYLPGLQQVGQFLKIIYVVGLCFNWWKLTLATIALDRFVVPWVSKQLFRFERFRPLETWAVRVRLVAPNRHGDLEA